LKTIFYITNSDTSNIGKKRGREIIDLANESGSDLSPEPNPKRRRQESLSDDDSDKFENCLSMSEPHNNHNHDNDKNREIINNYSKSIQNTKDVVDNEQAEKLRKELLDKRFEEAISELQQLRAILPHLQDTLWLDNLTKPCTRLKEYRIHCSKCVDPHTLVCSRS